eukprot:Pgem_evm1s501
MLTVIFFLWSNQTAGAAVHFNVQLTNTFNRTVPEISVNTYEFSLVNSVQAMLSSGSYALAILIAGMSGAWPYVKLLLLLVCWFAPIPTNVRGRVLQILEIAGKWSLIDLFVLCMMMVAFKFELVLPVITIGINVWPQFGIYSFCSATIMNASISHFMTFIHRKCIKNSEIRENDLENNEVDHVKANKIDCELTDRIVNYLLLLAFSLTLASQLLVSFEFEFTGLIGGILPPDSSFSEFSLMTCGLYIPKVSYNVEGAGPYILSAIYFTFIFFVPLLHIVGLCVLWEGNFSTKTTRQLFYSLEVIYAWSAIDVALVAIIAAVAEIGRLSGHIVQDYCTQLNIIIEEECFQVEAYLRNGVWTLIPTILLSYVLNGYVMGVMEHRLERRERLERKTIAAYNN